MFIPPQTWQNAWTMLSFFHSVWWSAINSVKDDQNVSYLAVRPTELNLIHAPQFMDVLSQLVPNLLQMRRHNNLRALRIWINALWWMTTRGSCGSGLEQLSPNHRCVTCDWMGGCEAAESANLAGFHRCGDEGGLWHELSVAQQISDSFHISFVLFHRFHFHLLFRKQSFITWCVTWWRQKLKVTMTTAQQ